MLKFKKFFMFNGAAIITLGFQLLMLKIFLSERLNPSSETEKIAENQVGGIGGKLLRRHLKLKKFSNDLSPLERSSTRNTGKFR